MSSLLNQGVSLSQAGYGLYGQLDRVLYGDGKKVHFIQGNTTLIEFDACMNESHTINATPSEFAIENGQTISDHIHISPFELQMAAIKTDTPIDNRDEFIQAAVVSGAGAVTGPIGILATAAAFTALGAQNKSPSPSQAAYEVMTRLAVGGMVNGTKTLPQIFDVVTSLRRYESMCIKSMSVARDASTGYAIVFQLTLAQVRIVSSQTVDVTAQAQPALSGRKKILAESSGDDEVSLASRQGALTADRDAINSGDLGKKGVALVRGRD